MSKKKNKKTVNEWGAFLQIPIDKIERNDVASSQLDNVPEDAFVFQGIASTGDLNRNGYKIRESAWQPALEDYMQNPIVLFQHSDDKGIGNTISAEMTDKGLEVTGFIYRDLDELHTGGAIGKGVYRSLSTGHITKDFEMENEKTDEVISKDEFKKMIDDNGWGEWMNDWTRAVTSLEFVEWSIVAVGSNKAAIRTGNNTEREFLSRFYEIDINADEEEAESEAESEKAPVETPEPAKEAEAEEEADSSETSDESGGETPAEAEAEEEAEPAETKAEEVKTESVSAETNAVEKDDEPAQEPEVNYAEKLSLQEEQILTLAKAILTMQKEVEKLTLVVNRIPDKKGLIVTRQFDQQPKEKKENAGEKEVRDLFSKVGIELK